MLFEKLDLEENEEILKMVRKHWFYIVSQLLVIVFVAFVPIVLLSIVLNLPPALGVSGINLDQYPAMIAFFIAAWLFFSVISGFVAWTHYYLDLWVITDRRIIAVQQLNFFNRNVAIFRLERMQDIEFRIKGIIPTFFNYGILSAQTAGQMEANFNSDYMPNPDALQATIQQAMDARLTELNNKPNLSGGE